MTNEEKAEEYISREDVVTENDRVPVDNGYGWQTVSFEDEVKRAYLDGLSEGRKELEKENAELKAQIEKMKCCRNCLKIIQCEMNVIDSVHCDKWELAE
ncbi:MAG: hypothetical protein MJZ11_08195 [Lachnospiraceae bacterium]|nr:hypothetical protein [Lachnospiraceae bacterium]